MKKIILIIAVVCIMPKVNAQQVLGVDTGKSIINWEGSDLLNLNKHNGTVKFSGGIIKSSSANVFNGYSNVIIGGMFEIDMNSILNTDSEYNDTLVAHLKGEDFFDVKKYPTAKLEILNVQYISDTNLDVTAYLTINGVRQIIKYQSTIENVNNQVVMKSKFEIDRTLWKINYKSEGFLFTDLKDDLISDFIDFEVYVVTSLDGC